MLNWKKYINAKKNVCAYAHVANRGQFILNENNLSILQRTEN